MRRSPWYGRRAHQVHARQHQSREGLIEVQCWPCPPHPALFWSWQLMSRRLYGPIWKSTFGHYENINIGSPVVLEQLLRQEGKYPMRSDMALWKEHRDTRRLPYGPFTE